jgi:hypothetical protein
MNALARSRILNQFIEPVGRFLNDEAAQTLLGLRADSATQARIEDLAAKCTKGALTPSERSEYEMYVWACEFIAILQAKARKLLVERSRARLR